MSTGPDITFSGQQELFDKISAQVFAELGGGSDRACAVVAGALLDDVLGRLLEAYLIEHADGADELLSSENVNAPLGSFGARIVAAYAVGLLRPGEREALRKVKKIRNSFAHDLEVDFRDAQVLRLCGELVDLCPTQNYGNADRSPRQLFQASVALLAGRFSERLYFVKTFGVSGGFSSAFVAMRGAHGCTTSPANTRLNPPAGPSKGPAAG